MTDLPRGTVTFLFTDIEGSTKLWQQFPDAMPSALARHHELLTQAIERHNGYVFQIIGDAFCVAFATAPDALDAALDAQRALRDASWGATGPIRVRMAIHTGIADVIAGNFTSGEYVSGITLSRVARLLSAGYGGQILLSASSAELVREQLPPLTSLRELGAHRLKDLVNPQLIFQTFTADLLQEFPALKTLDAFPNNLPIQPTSFIGREKELGEIRRLLSKTHLLTLIGAGGSGKTRLALQFAADAIDEFERGAWFVELAPITDPTLVANAVRVALDLREESGRSDLEVVTDYLRNKVLFVILDNCEHLVEACAQLASHLLTHCPNVQILATSREALNIAGEVLYQVPTLGLPDPKRLPSLDTLSQYDAVRLFIERALAVQTTFTITNSNAPAVAQICYRLDGIPLAIELAAARIKLFSPEQIAARLDDRLRLLASGSRNALPRQQTLRGAIDWSHSLLSDKERILFRRLAVFAAGWTFEAAEAVCSGEGMDAFDVLELLAQLVNKSLVTAELQGDETRYRMLETIREYALEKLSAAGETDMVRSRHLRFFITFAEHAKPHLMRREQLEWFDKAETEQDNLRSAVNWACEHKNVSDGLRIVTAFQKFWEIRGGIQQAREWLEQLIFASADKPPSQEYGRALLMAAIFSTSGTTDARTRATERAYEALALFRDLGDAEGIAQSLFGLSKLTMDAAEWTALLEEMLAVSTAAHDEANIILALDYLGGSAVLAQENEKGLSMLKEALRRAEQLGERYQIASVLFSLAMEARDRGNAKAAKAYMTRRIELCEQLGSSDGVARTLTQLAAISHMFGEYPQMLEYAIRAAAIWQELGRLEDNWVEAVGFQSWGYMHLNDDARAQEAFLLVVDAVGRMSSPQVSMMANFFLSHLEMLRGNFENGQRLLQQDLIWWRRVENFSNAVDVIDELGIAEAHLALRSNEFARLVHATRLLSAANALFKTHSLWLTVCFQKAQDSVLPDLQAALGAQEFEAAWGHGLDLTIKQAIALALNEND